MGAREPSSADITPIQMSLRIRHPSIDPDEISETLGLKAEHCFKAGASRGPRAAGHHTQTYWLAPVSTESAADHIEPAFLAAIAASSGRSISLPADEWREATENMRTSNPEYMLLYFLQRLNLRQTFLQQIQREGGDVALIILMERESSADFTVPPSVSRLLAQLDMTVEMRFA